MVGRCVSLIVVLPFGGVHRTLQRVRLFNRGRLLLWTPGPVPYGTCICSNVKTILSWTCHVYGPFEFRTSLGTSILLIKEFDTANGTLFLKWGCHTRLITLWVKGIKVICYQTLNVLLLRKVLLFIKQVVTCIFFHFSRKIQIPLYLFENRRTHPHLLLVPIKSFKFESGIKMCFIYWYMYHILYRTTTIFSQNGDCKLAPYMPKVWLFL